MKNCIEPQELIRILFSERSLNKTTIPKFQDRFDLRDIDLRGLVSGKRPVSNFTFKDCDFSGGNLEDTSWKLCRFENVVFTNVQANSICFWGCNFDNVTFTNCLLRDALLGGREDRNLGQFQNVTFTKCDLRASVYSNPLFKNCNFVYCKLDSVDFGGSRFEHCRFSGLIKETMFREKEQINRRLYPNAISLPNAMVNVDFTNAVLEGVRFFGAVDLTTCLFPESDDYIIIRKNRKKIFEKVREYINDPTSPWTPLDRKIGMTLLDAYYLDPKRNGQEIEVIRDFFGDKEFELKFFGLIRQVKEQYNG